MCIDVAGYKIINVYKPPRSRLTLTTIPTFPHSSLYVCDFNCQHVNWGYDKTSPDGESLDSWATSNNLGLLRDPKEAASFSSHRWNVGTNPDLAFASFAQDNRLPDRRVLGKFGLSTREVDHDQVATQDIEDSFSAKKKAGAVFVHLTAAYNTLVHRGLTCKLLQLLPE